ncbi:uncharacterized protein LOC106657183 [Trichogramma pretiosum]|uniref:uncharacterized protein LOC106657183 n=1 Tax=Trichogramma pretiosum TaxID=7493 RepID=UPI0006C95DC1|nr:uncharacterized protein LOC106657183 [Trichogramma pretiosum]
MTDNQVYIASACRTPIGSFCGTFSTLKASELGTVVIKESLKRANVKPKEVSGVILGQTLTAGTGQNPARQASIKAGLPIDVPAYLVNMLCGSGLKAIMNAYMTIKCGEGDIVVAGGQENMSAAPHSTNIRLASKSGDSVMRDTMLFDGLTDAFCNIHMGITAENIAEKYEISREDQDKYAVQSQQRTEMSIKNGHFDKEIVPTEVKIRRQTVLVSKDEYPKSGVTFEDLSKARAVFKEGGTVTAGNASGINDGAAAVVVMSGKVVKEKGIKPMARIVAIAEAGVLPEMMGEGPIPAVKLLLEKAGWHKDEVDLYELNEAFAAQAVRCVKGLNIDEAKVNVDGGAIALGHPIGASGARVVVTLLHSMERRNAKKGVAALCVGGGMGVAIAVERD